MYTDAEDIREDMRFSLPESLDIHRTPVPQYSDIEHQTWATLYANQQKVLPGRACQDFLAGLEAIAFPHDHIPRLADVSDRLFAATGWRLCRVDGIVPDREFFELLAQRIFPSTDFIRKPEEIAYTPAPDMFHDLLGHTPLLTSPRFTSFFEQFGRAGVNAFKLDHAATTWLPRIYWYLVEFGLLKTEHGMRIFGSGILSSPQEVLYSLSDATIKLPADLELISNTSYDVWHMQDKLFVIKSFEELEAVFVAWCERHGLL